MRLFGLVTRYVSNGCKRIGGAFFRIAQRLDALLPALFSPTHLSRLTHVHYEDSYRDASGHNSAEAYGTGLLEWEEDVLVHHKIVSGTTMVLGDGVGRVSIEFARRGLRVIGLDISRDALRLAALTAQKRSTHITLVQASFYDIPTLPACVDYIFLSGIMYSSIPGRQARQAWLRRLQTHLRSGGLAVLNYYISLDRTEPLTDRPAYTLNSWLAGLPGANPTYQPGDLVSHDHFLHAFVSEEELRSELTEAGATIVQLNWDKQFAVLTWLHEPVCNG